jgi:putative pyruvate formate lyase activating enzyme
MDNLPGYLKLHHDGVLEQRVADAQKALLDCRLCGWDCGINRHHALGPCRTGMGAVVASAYVHFGEELPLVVGGGSGAIFFSNCDMRCQFCQTARWNIHGQGQRMSAQLLAGLMLDLQHAGAANINLVTPTHVVPQIITAVSKAASEGLRIPLVWNSGGHDSVQALHLLDGIVDIYLPDMKYSEAKIGRSLSAVPDYPSVNRQAVTEMFRQVGHLLIDEAGRARHGLLVRHLVMPGMIDNTADVLRWLAETLGPRTYLSLMDQYRPAYRAFARHGINRSLQPQEYQKARALALSLGLERLDDRLLLRSESSSS